MELMNISNVAHKKLQEFIQIPQVLSLPARICHSLSQTLLVCPSNSNYRILWQQMSTTEGNDCFQSSFSVACITTDVFQPAGYQPSSIFVAPRPLPQEYAHQNVTLV
jgi:hypothetical protein